MLYTHFTEELLGLQGVKITNIENSKKSITVYAELGYCGDWQSLYPEKYCLTELAPWKLFCIPIAGSIADFSFPTIKVSAIAVNK